MGISEEIGGATSSEVAVISSQEKLHEVNITSDEHLARQLQAFENILIGTPDNEFHDIISMEPPSQFIEPNSLEPPSQFIESNSLEPPSQFIEPNSLEPPSQFIEPNPVPVPVPLEEPLSDVGLNSENVQREEVQALGEQIGTENKGLSDELISYLPASKYRTGFFSRKTTEECVVCKTYFKNGQNLITLPCQHRYHADCITQWLQLNKVCPVCNEEVFGS